MANENGDRVWHLDKRVPVALISALALHAIVFVWTFSALNTRVEFLERYVGEARQMATGDRLVRLETHMENITSEIRALGSKLDRQRDGKIVFP